MKDVYEKNRSIPMLGTGAIVAGFLIIWEIMAQREIIDVFFFSQPSSVIRDLVYMFTSGEIYQHLTVTMTAAFWGLIYGFVAGVALAFLLSQNQLLADILDPILIGIYGLPKLALAPLFIVWFGIGIQSKIFLATLMVFFLVFFNAYAGFKSVDRNLINAVKTLGGKKLQVFQKVIFPSCLPWIMTGLRAGLGVGILGAIVGEYMGANRGLGWMIQYASVMYDVTRVLTCIIILMFFMAFLDYILKIVEKNVLKWRPTSE